MKRNSWFSIAALIVLLALFVLIPVSDTAAGRPPQIVRGSVGRMDACPTPPPNPPYASEPTTISPPELASAHDARLVCGHCPQPGLVTHTFAVTAGAEIEITADAIGCFVGYRIVPETACVQVSFSFPGATHYACVGPEDGQITVKVSGIGAYEITVTESEVIEDPEVLAGLQRINSKGSIPYIIYVPTAQRVAEEHAQFIDVWQVDQHGVGQPLLYVSNETLLALPDFPAENLLIATSADGLVNVYKLTTGEYQVNIGPLDEGKVYTYIFDGIPPTHVSTSTWIAGGE